MTNLKEWLPESWKEKPGKQLVNYPESLQASHDDVMNKLHSLPPLVSHVEIDQLRAQLAEVATGGRFLLQGGDCAELFEYCSQVSITSFTQLTLAGPDREQAQSSPPNVAHTRLGCQITRRANCQNGW